MLANENNNIQQRHKQQYAVPSAFNINVIKSSHCHIKTATTTTTFRSGAFYKGGVKGTQRNGLGEFVWSNGGRYEGAYKDNKRHGNGTYVWPDGSIYVGTFENDMRQGKGKQVWSSGENYEGDFHNDYLHGSGAYRWTDGSIYKGTFDKNNKSGYGYLVKGNGDTFEGMYKENIRSGPGIYTYHSSRNQDVGIWRGSKLIRTCFKVENVFAYHHLKEHCINAHKNSSSQPNSYNFNFTHSCFDEITDLNSLEYSASFPYTEITNGIRVVRSSPGRLETLSHDLLMAASQGDAAEVSKILSTNHVHPNVTDCLGYSALLAASINCHVEVMHILLDSGANVNETNAQHVTCLSACHMLLHTSDNFVRNLAENMEAENLFNSVEFDDKHRTVVNRNDRRTILAVYEREYNSKKALPNKSYSNKVSVIGLRDIRSPSLLPGVEESELQEKETRDQWKIEHYHYTMQRVEEVHHINRLFESFNIIQNNRSITRQVSFDRDQEEPALPPLATSQGSLDRQPLPPVRKNTEIQLINKQRKPHLEGVIDVLLRRGADPNLCVLPMPVLFFALKCADVSAVRNLLHRGARTNTRLQNTGISPLHIAVGLPSEEGVELTKLLLEHGAEVNARDTWFSTHQNQDEETDRTALHIACSREDNHQQAAMITRILLEHRADPNLLCCGNSALSLAISSGNEEIIDILLEFGVDVSLPLDNGLGSALCVAVSFQGERCRTPNQRIKLLDKLIKYRANLLTPVVVSDKFPAGTVVDYAYHVFTQDRRIAFTPYHALTAAEREIHSTRRRLLKYIGGRLRTAALKKEAQFLRQPQPKLTKAEGGSKTQLMSRRRFSRVLPNKIKRDKTCGLRCALIEVMTMQKNEGEQDTIMVETKHRYRYCYCCGRSIGVRLTACARCKEVFYCSKSCKTRGWNTIHKAECTKEEHHVSRGSSSRRSRYQSALLSEKLQEHNPN